FHAPVGYAAGAAPEALSAGDFTGDQFPDLVVSTAGATNLALLTNQFSSVAAAGTPSQRFIAQVYLDVLGRQVDPSGLASWSAAIDAGASRSRIVAQIEASEEYRTLRVRDMYRRLLGREADPTGLSGFVAFLGRGGTLERTEASILGSEEYFQRAGGS